MQGKPYYRIGQIVPSSNATMETESPAMFRARETVETIVPNAGALLSGPYAVSEPRGLAA